jgi:alkylhydroperoxidase/carboxymuconolactone decarboxylase family protein YurZ
MASPYSVPLASRHGSINGNTDQPVYHLGLAKHNGATDQELIEAISHLAFNAGGPRPTRR